MNSPVALSLLLVIAPCFTQAGPVAPAGRDCFEYQDVCYRTPADACQAVADERRADRANDSPYGRVVGAKDTGDSFWCKLADKNGNDTEQTYGSKRSVKNDTPLGVTPHGDRPTMSSGGCESDRSKGAALRQNAAAKPQNAPDIPYADVDPFTAEIARNNPNLVHTPTNSIPARTDKTVFRNQPVAPKRGPSELDQACVKFAEQRGGGAEFSRKNARSKR